MGSRGKATRQRLVRYTSLDKIAGKAMFSPKLALMFVLPQLQAQPPWPRFDQYLAAATFTGKPAAPILRSSGDRLFRTAIREGAAKGPNFAGHYTIVEWGCGSSCVSIVVVDAKTGKIGESPFSILGYGTSLRFPDGTRTHSEKFDELAYKLNSRLLIVRGCPEDTECGAYYYEWTVSGFKLLRKGAAAVDTK